MSERNENSQMNKKDSRIYGLDIIRIICTAAVFIYHLNRDILKGGYLAVCVFLVLYGYLLAVSAMRKDKFSLAGYYAKRIIRLEDGQVTYDGPADHPDAMKTREQKEAVS